MKEFTRAQLATHLKWIYSQPGYYKKNKWVGRRQKIKIYKYHEEWAVKNGYRPILKGKKDRY